MKYEATIYFDKDSKIKGLKDEANYAAGAVSILPPFSDEAATLEFEDLEAELDAADAAITTSNFNSHPERINLVHAAAMLRDAEYATASRRFVKALGVQGSFRHLYEVGKSHIDTNGI